MRLELDHIFICTSVGAPEGDELVRIGLLEGEPNQHPGQGTANRRFAFRNSMIELLWVSDAEEARNERTRQTRLWERWSGRESGASPFGICMRPGGATDGKAPFDGWEYRPAYLPDPLSLYIGDAGIEEPMWVYLDFLSRAQREQHFREHRLGVCEITRVTLHSPVSLHSAAAKAVIDNGVLSAQAGPEALLEVEFDGDRRGRAIDLRPRLPLVFKI